MIWHAKYYVNEKDIGFNVKRFKTKKGRIVCKLSGKDCGEFKRTK
jgi:hypothetical protein